MAPLGGGGGAAAAPLGGGATPLDGALAGGTAAAAIGATSRAAGPTPLGGGGVVGRSALHSDRAPAAESPAAQFGAARIATTAGGVGAPIPGGARIGGGVGATTAGGARIGGVGATTAGGVVAMTAPAGGALVSPGAAAPRVLRGLNLYDIARARAAAFAEARATAPDGFGLGGGAARGSPGIGSSLFGSGTASSPLLVDAEARESALAATLTEARAVGAVAEAEAAEARAPQRRAPRALTGVAAEMADRVGALIDARNLGGAAQPSAVTAPAAAVNPLQIVLDWQHEKANYYWANSKAQKALLTQRALGRVTNKIAFQHCNNGAKPVFIVGGAQFSSTRYAMLPVLPC